jgi:hypothetical protein
VKPTFPPVSLERVPDVNLDDFPEGRRNLDSTRPAPLDPVIRNESDSTFSYYLSLGRSYLKFYKTGMKNIWANWNEFSEIKGWLHPFTLDAAARYGGTTHYNKKNENIPIPHITRREYQLYHKTKHDLLKLLPFGLILLICGEFTPLVILALGNRVTPYTCRIPSQQRKAYDDTLDRFRTFQREMRQLTRRSVPQPRHTFDFTPPGRRQEHPWRRDLLFAHLANQTNFYSLPFPLTAGLYWHFTLQPRLQKYWDKVFCDTVLIRREGGFAALSPQDIYEYARNFGSLSLFVIMQYELGYKKNYDFINEDLKARLVPVLEKEADEMFVEDFTRLSPTLHWVRAYRDNTRWAQSADVQTALKLMREFGMEWSPELGGRWVVKGDEKGASEAEKTDREADKQTRRQETEQATK